MNQKGFAAHLVVIVVAVVMVVGAIGFFVYHKNKANALYISEWGCHSTATLSQGSTGACVVALQYRINGTKCFAQMKTDGNFGPTTKARVIDYQRKAGWTGDGIVGSNTWGNILDGTPGKTVNCTGGK